MIVLYNSTVCPVQKNIAEWCLIINFQFSHTPVRCYTSGHGKGIAGDGGQIVYLL